jgi:hypothetical protein
MEIYNSRNPQMRFPLPRVGWVLLICWLAPRLTFAADWHQPVAELTQKIAAITGPGVASLEVINRSSLSAADAEQVRRELTSALQAVGVRIWQPDQAAANIKLTLSENLQEYVWVAEVHQAANDLKTAFVSFPRPDWNPSPQTAPPIAIRAMPLIARPEAMLDVLPFSGAPQRILVLGRDAVTMYEMQSGRWVLVQSFPVVAPTPLPHDARGRLMLGKDHLFDAYLPGLICQSTNSTPLRMNCGPSEDPWPLNVGLSAFFSPARNFFTGALVPGIGKQRSAPPFYSAAAIPRSGYALWIFAGLDGQVHLLDGINNLVLSRVRWGSDVAALHAACRPDWQVLADSPDAQSSDSLQAFEFADREPAAVSPKLGINGAVTGLWAAPDGGSAIAIYQDSATKNYEAMQLNLDCAR